MTSTKIAFVLLLFVAAATMAAPAQTQVFVPGNTNGAFGNQVDLIVPLVPAITVDGPGTITVTYVSGTVDFGAGVEVGPNGGPWDVGTWQLPLQEAKGVAGGKVNNDGALIGVFVPHARLIHKGFSPIDGTKDAARVGIMPGWLFFIGEGKTIDAKEAGTLFLGINDCWVGDNSGGFNVEVSVQQH